MIEPFVLTGEIEPKVANSFFTLAATNFITDLIISSPGGDIGLTFGMFDVIRMQGINTHAVGLAQSAAAALFQAGKKRTMTNSSLLMFHSPAEDVTGEEFRLCTQLAEMVQQRTGMHISEARDLFDNRFINANRAIELGLADEIVTDVLSWTRDGRRQVWKLKADGRACAL